MDKGIEIKNKLGIAEGVWVVRGVPFGVMERSATQQWLHRIMNVLHAWEWHFVNI